MVYSDKSYSVLIVSNAPKITDHLISMLSDSVYYPIATSTNAAQASRLVHDYSYDLVIINTPLKDQLGIDFALDINQDSNAGILLLVKSEHFEQISERVNEFGVLTLSKPTSSAILHQTIKLITATRERLKKLETTNQKLKSKMDEIRIVNHAKWALISYLSMNEEQAHKYIEKQAMDMRITKREAAINIIKMYENNF